MILPRASQDRLAALKKACLECGRILDLKTFREVAKKKYCSYRCRQLRRWRLGEMPWFIRASKLCNSPEANAKKGRPGPKHSGWIKDRSKLKTRHRHEHAAWRKEVFERDDYTCVLCHQRGGKLHADHIKRWRDFPELRFEITNGRTLCVSCHKTTDTYGNKKVTSVIASCFSELAASGTSVRDLALFAGVSLGTAYRHLRKLPMESQRLALRHLFSHHKQAENAIFQ